MEKFGNVGGGDPSGWSLLRFAGRYDLNSGSCSLSEESSLSVEGASLCSFVLKLNSLAWTALMISFVSLVSTLSVVFGATTLSSRSMKVLSTVRSKFLRSA